jgi:hypothetical protein
VCSLAATSVLCRWFHLQPARLYDIFAELLSACNLFALALCAFLTWKGLNMPSTSDCGTNGSLLYDFYWGRLHI